MKKIKFFALWALLLTPPLLLSGCGDDATDDPTPGKTPVLTIKDNALGVINVEAAGQTVTLNYEVADAVEGKLAVAKAIRSGYMISIAKRSGRSPSWPMKMSEKS